MPRKSKQTSISISPSIPFVLVKVRLEHFDFSRTSSSTRTSTGSLDSLGTLATAHLLPLDVIHGFGSRSATIASTQHSRARSRQLAT